MPQKELQTLIPKQTPINPWSPQNLKPVQDSTEFDLTKTEK